MVYFNRRKDPFPSKLATNVSLLLFHDAEIVVIFTFLLIVKRLLSLLRENSLDSALLFSYTATAEATRPLDVHPTHLIHPIN